jgi:hypothetical protein
MSWREERATFISEPKLYGPKESVPVPEKEIREVLPPLHVLPFPLQAFSERVVSAIFHQNRVPEPYP